MAEIIQLSKFRADLSAKSGSTRKNEILSAPDTQGAVQALHPTELYALVHELGEGDAMDLVALASTEQVRALIDISAWRDDHLDFEALDKWFMAALAHGQGHASQMFHALDEDLQTLYLSHGLRIYQVHDEEAPEDDVQRFTSPDGTFILEPSEPEAKIMHLVADLYANDWQEADTMLRDAKYTITSEIEEEVRRVREERLAELGFPSREDAIRLFAPPKVGPMPKRQPLGEARRHLPARYAESLLGASFLTQVFTLIQDDVLLGDLESELISLTNLLLIADNGEPGDLEAVVAAGANLRHTLSLGLEMLSTGDAMKAAELVKAHPLRAIFRQANGHVLKLRAWADRARREGLFDIPGVKTALPSEEAQFLSALLQPIPRYAEKTFATPRAFGSRAELGMVQRRLEQLAQRLIATKWLLGARSSESLLEGLVPGREEATYRPILRSALLHRALGDEADLAVTPAQLTAFAQRFTGAWPEAVARPTELVPVLDQEWAQLVKDVSDAGVGGEPRYLDLLTR